MSTPSALLVRGSVFRAGHLAIGIIIAFFMMPFIIHSVGQRYYGMWAVISTIIGYLGYLDFGLSKAAQNFISRATGKGDQHEVSRIITTALFVFTVIGAFAFVLSLVVAAAGPYFFEDVTELWRFRLVIVIMGLNFALSFPMMAYNGLFSANFRYDIATAIELGKLISTNLLFLYFINQGYSIIALAVITTVVQQCGNIVKLVVFKRMFPTVGVRKNAFARDLIGPLYGYGWKAFLHSIADFLRFEIDLMVVTAFVNLSAVTIYNIAGQLVMYFRFLLGSVIGVIVPLYAQYDASQQMDKLREAFSFSAKIAAVLSVILGGSAIVFGEAFIRIWMGDEFAESYTVMTILLCGAMFHVSQEPALALAYGTAQHGPYAKVAMLEGILNIILSIVLVKIFGLIGVAYGTTLPMILSATYIMYFAATYLSEQLSHHLLRLASIFLKGGLLHLGAWWIVSKVSITGYGDLFLLFGIIFPIQCAILFWSTFHSAERGRIYETLGRTFKSVS